MTKEKAPSTPEEGNNPEPILDPFWSQAKVQEMSDQWLEELKPLCKTDLEIKLSESVTKLFARQCPHLEAINTQDRAIGHLQEQINFLKGGYDELCISNDASKKNFWELTVRQKDFIEEVKNAMRLVKMRLTKAGL